MADPHDALEDFVGRAAELARLGARLAAPGPAILVTGAAGVGKSRLVAQALRRFRGEVARADLGAARDLEDALRRIGRALAIELEGADEPARVIARIGRVLASRAPALLWLDDADAVVEACGEAIAAWAAGEVRVVVTSRRARLEGAHETLSLGPLARDEAVALLVERARRVRRDFAVTGAQRAHVWDLVERVDALPLAIELLAPRLRLLSPARLLERLERGRGPADALRDALDRSFELLSPWEKDALAQCTVFRDGFYVDAAEAVVRLEASAPDVLTVLEALVDASLLRTEAAPELPDEVRVRFFGAVRERAAEELRDEAPVRARHAAFFADAAERWDAGIESPDEVEHTARLVIELANLEAAHRGSAGATRARLGLSLHMAYQRRGPFARMRELVEDARACAEGDDRLVARAELARARTLRWDSALDASEAALEAALGAARRAGDVETEAGVARNRAANAYRRGDLAGFEAHLAHALDAAARSGRASDEVNALNGLGYLYAERGELERAREALERALALARGTRIPGLVALAHSSLSAAMLRAERFEAAEHHASEAIARYGALGYLRQWAIEHLVRAEARLWADDLAGAHEDAAAALDRARWLALDAPLARALALRGKVAFFEQDFAAARDALEEAAARFGEGHAEAGPLWAYAGAARAMMQHADAAAQALARAPEGELTRALRAFVRIAAAKVALAHGEDVALGSLAPAPPSSTVEVRRVVELAGALARSIAPSRDAGAVRLEIGDGARWFRLEGDAEGVDLTRRRALRGVLAGLVDRRRSEPGAPMSVDAVLEAGWPGERMSPESGARRVYVTINRLRKLGLGDVLVTTGDGYMLAPHVDVVTA
ncbi:MAG: AAA family ATPase [Sandaracinaceae bacterium]|nr:AAA family ATPase [Sandaracinaceae bacterium]